MTQGVRLARNSAYSLSMLLGILSLFFSHFTASLSMDPVLRDRRIGISADGPLHADLPSATTSSASISARSPRAWRRRSSSS